ncbi:thioesterase II family protein [Streptomyces sp. NPDC059720]|uniref:thioesterase II family protein n=1 Tax=Streptomyces sp. NPDC059720 TaxID=3346924 RepID=UPI00369C8379
MNSTWFRRFTTPGSGPRLVCFPHAGGSATAYRTLAQALPADLDVVCVQYPGRQDRHREAPFTDLTLLAGAVADELAPMLAADPGRPYALFGHSMGSLVAFETARLLARGPLPGPQRLFLSGRGAPDAHSTARFLRYDDEDMLAEVRRLGGTTPSMLDDPDIVEMVLPALRADYRALGTYAWRGGEPLAAAVTVLVGDSDPMVTVQEAGTWRAHSRGDVVVKVFPGGHFYLFDHLDGIAAAVTEGLLAEAAAS